VANGYNHEYMLVFTIEVAEEVTKNQIYGALYKQTDVMEATDLSTLQRTGLVGVCQLEGDGKSWVLKIPFTMPLARAALLAAAIELIDSVNGSKATFRLADLIQRKKRLVSLAKRAKELMARIGNSENTQRITTPL